MIGPGAAAIIERVIAERRAQQAAAAKRRAEAQPQTRMYAAAKASRLTSGWQTSTTSADSELVSSLRSLRDRARALVRDASYAKRAKRIIVNNVIGAGVGMQAQILNQRGRLLDEVNGPIEDAWGEWSRATNCHTGGSLHFADLERAAMAQVFETGEAFLRLHLRPFGESTIPLALELVESERLADEFQAPTPAAAVTPGATLRMGVEVDAFYRPLAYWVRQRHPGELRMTLDSTDKLERVPARDMFHLRIIDRWPQTRGEPWLHAVVRRLNDMDGYSEAEIVAARGAASYMATIESPDGNASIGEEENEADGTLEVEISPGVVQRLGAGEKFNFVTPNRPNTALDPFMRYMLREVAAGADVSYESLSRDYSQSNYSSSRLALLDDRDTWRALQMWWIRNFREPLHRLWLQQAVFARAVPIAAESYAASPRKYSAVKFKPRGWSWIDPTKEVEAARASVRAGFDTITDVIARTGEGRDIEDVVKTKQRELAMFAEAGLTVDTDPAQILTSGETMAEPPPPEDLSQPAARASSEARIVSMGRR